MKRDLITVLTGRAMKKGAIRKSTCLRILEPPLRFLWHIPLNAYKKKNTNKISNTSVTIPCPKSVPAAYNSMDPTTHLPSVIGVGARCNLDRKLTCHR